ncbi:hypothetical protein WJX81_008064 [Elliptochloris bilobata]|uniref:Uncharacterized protein n=1 Tax=Elliptochloris bilobata TaxID=381761 RepID=A0AAW1QM16_9CHLO
MGGGPKVVAVLPRGSKAESNPDYHNCVEDGLGLRGFLEEKGNEFVTTDKKEGPESDLDKLLPSTDVLMITPFQPRSCTGDLGLWGCLWRLAGKKAQFTQPLARKKAGKRHDVA